MGEGKGRAGLPAWLCEDRRWKMIRSMDETLNTRARASFVETDHTKALRLCLYCANRPNIRQSELSCCKNSLVVDVSQDIFQIATNNPRNWARWFGICG